MTEDARTAKTYSRWALCEGKLSVTEYNKTPISMIKEFLILNTAKNKKMEHTRNMQESGNTGKTYAFD